MKNKKKLIITIVVCVLAILLVSGILYSVTKKKKAAPAGTASGAGGGATSNASSSSSSSSSSSFPLKYGSRGALVKTLQSKMNDWMAYYYFTLSTKPSASQLVVDGIFGPKTQEFAQIIFSSNAVSESGYNWLISQNYQGNMGTDSLSWWFF